MGRYVGLTNNRGKGGGGGLGPVKPYTRSTGITTNTENNVTEVVLDDVEYTAMQYDSVGLVTGYNENFGGSKKGWICTYTSSGLINTVVERVPPHYDPRYTITPSVTAVDEGSPVTFSINSTGVADGTTVYYSLVGVSTSDVSGDFASLTGDFTINGSVGVVTATPLADSATEGTETFKLSLYTDSGRTVNVKNSAVITINDTSISNVDNIAFYTPGTTTWTCPAGITEARVIVIGGGGGGGGSGGGAGGGAALKKYTNLSPGTAYSLTVGAGGQRLNSSNGNNGGTSEFQGPGVTVSATGGAGWGNGGNSGTYGGGGGSGSNGDINGTGGNGSPYDNDPVSAYGYTTNPQGNGVDGGGGGGGGGADNGPAINGGAGSYFAGGGGGGGSDNGQGGDGGDGGTLRIKEFVATKTRAFGGGGGGTDGTNNNVYGGPGGTEDGVQGQGYGDGSNNNTGGDGGGPAVSRGEKGIGQGQNAGGGGGGAFGGGGGGAGHNDSNNVMGAGGGGLVYITFGSGVPSTYTEES